MSRKNFLFCDTAKGADASALCFSMIETAKRNGLDSFGYLLLLLQELPKLGKPPAEEQLERIFPWSNTIPVYRHLTWVFVGHLGFEILDFLGQTGAYWPFTKKVEFFWTEN